jgi:hypothetical protein
MDSLEELETFTFEMIAKQDRLTSQAKKEGKSLQHIAELYSRQEGMKIIYTKILQIKKKGNRQVGLYHNFCPQCATFLRKGDQGWLDYPLLRVIFLAQHYIYEI